MEQLICAYGIISLHSAVLSMRTHHPHSFAVHAYDIALITLPSIGVYSHLPPSRTVSIIYRLLVIVHALAHLFMCVLPFSFTFYCCPSLLYALVFADLLSLVCIECSGQPISPRGTRLPARCIA